MLVPDGASDMFFRQGVLATPQLSRLAALCSPAQLMTARPRPGLRPGGPDTWWAPFPGAVTLNDNRQFSQTTGADGTANLANGTYTVSISGFDVTASLTRVGAVTSMTPWARSRAVQERRCRRPGDGQVFSGLTPRSFRNDHVTWYLDRLAGHRHRPAPRSSPSGSLGGHLHLRVARNGRCAHLRPGAGGTPLTSSSRLPDAGCRLCADGPVRAR